MIASEAFGTQLRRLPVPQPRAPFLNVCADLGSCAAGPQVQYRSTLVVPRAVPCTPQVLADNKILSVPVLDDEGEYLGAFSVGDVLRVLMQELESQLSHGWFERMGSLTAAELETVGAAVGSKKVASVTHRELREALMRAFSRAQVVPH
jgi:hypothetical protein